MNTIHSYLYCFFLVLITISQPLAAAQAASIATIDTFDARPPIHILTGSASQPQGLTPLQIKAAYNLPSSGGNGTIAIVTAYYHPALESDLGAFDTQFSLPPCTVKNKCLEIHAMSTATAQDSGWNLETALDSEWAHAIAPTAKILVVESASSKEADLMKAIDYARGRADVVSVSMSWGGNEFSAETTLDKHFAATHKNQYIAFFASSGDDGSGASWPAVSPTVISVGGTSLVMRNVGFVSEKAWTGSGGGISAYEPEPSFQKNYSVSQAQGKRAIPDVAFAADPQYGFSVFHSNRWYVIGGTSAGAPQWAAIATLGKPGAQSITLDKLYFDKASLNQGNFFRDIVSGKNGSCIFYCQARKRYDYVTGLGTPLTYSF